jgi:ATP citrate (pro-S)-lyase
VAIIADSRKQERYLWGEQEITIPVFESIAHLPDELRSTITTVLNVQSGRRALKSMTDAITNLPKLNLATIFAEQVPENHTQEIATLAHQKGILISGPASVGILVPGVLKLCAIGGTRPQQIQKAHICEAGDTAVISTSGGMVNELIHAVTRNGSRISFALALGGERYPITTPADALLLAESDATTKQIVYFGELGGTDEYEIIELIKSGKLTKKIIAYVAGTVAELFDTPPQFGHAKAMAKNSDESARTKKEAMRTAGVQVLDSLSEIDELLKTGATQNTRPVEERVIGPRKVRPIMSTLSGDQNGDVQLLGDDLLKTIDNRSYANLVLSMLLGKNVETPRLSTFIDYTLRLLVDHGPYVSGALNTIVTARAGRDLVSSLSAGLLTVGPRFGGAINEAARGWLEGVQHNESVIDFVQRFATQHQVISGIGHKKYRIDLPDPRVVRLRALAQDDNGEYLRFALGVEQITTAKKGNLILNVDGAIAALLLDLLHDELDYGYDELQELVDIEFFNALFVLSRSVGFVAHFLDQKRHDEGLLRLTPEEIAYIPQK